MSSNPKSVKAFWNVATPLYVLSKAPLQASIKMLKSSSLVEEGNCKRF